MNLENNFIKDLKRMHTIDEIRIKMMDKGIPIIELEQKGFIINPDVDNFKLVKPFINAYYGKIQW